MLPVRVVGSVRVEHGEPTIFWHLEPLPRGAQSYADFSLISGSLQMAAQRHADMQQQALRNINALRPGIVEWYNYSYHQDNLDVFHPDSATKMAYGWLKSDLQRIKWLG